MTTVDRLIRRKTRLARRVIRRDDKRAKRRGVHVKMRKRTLLRARLFKIDARLEAYGLFPHASPSWENGWLIGAVRMPGRNAGYRAGRCLMQGVVVHYTVGRDSTGPGLRGLFPFLLAKDGTIKQFAEVDAVCAHACEWNTRMTGVETEKLRPPTEEPTTDAQINSFGRLAGALREYGIQPDGYDGSTDRLPIGAPLRQPYTAHRTLRHIKCDQHSDYLLDAEMARVLTIAGGSVETTQEDDDDMHNIYIIEVGPIQGWLVGDGTRYSWISENRTLEWFRAARGPGPFHLSSQEIHVTDRAWADSLVAQAPPPPH